MTIFAKLPADARRALARAELRRRGLALNPEQPYDFDAILPFVSMDDLRHLKALLTGAEAGGELQVLLRTQEQMLKSRQPGWADEPAPVARYVPDPSLKTTEERIVHQQRHSDAFRNAWHLRQTGPASDAALAAVGRLIAEHEAEARAGTPTARTAARSSVLL